ncbi:ribonuclease T2 family protein [Pontibaca salina]|uniref:Ribonuclease T2 n=1 Tax=Pontibaca salina TaxID=2795731 RepID=A0A934HKB4_9RHOB|nr:ribonuclease T2 [Pontibaca salina]MBI6629749.1 ribonuclease T2 [Pontibaca salina]
MYRTLLSTLLSLTLATASPAEGARAGTFDYYVLSLGWSPNWCAQTGAARGDDQCDSRHSHGWTLHGLWPQWQRGYPSWCETAQPPPTRAMTATMADIMGSAGLAWHQWQKHGSCTGFSAANYFALSRSAYAMVNRPPALRQLDRAIKLPASVVEEAFLKANPDWHADMLTITCKDGHIQEARLCLSRTLKPMQCGPDVRRDCTLLDAVLLPIR